MKLFYSNGRIRLLPVLSLLLIFGVIILTASRSMPPLTLFFVAPTPQPTQNYMWAYVEIVKPGSMTVSQPLPTGTPIIESASVIIENTATSTPVDTVMELPTLTETPGQLAMEVIVDTPTPVYVAPTPKPASADTSPSYSYGGSKYILVDISEQHMYVYEGDTLVYSFVASTGMNNSTRAGNFAVQSKIPNAYGSTWDIWMPNWLGIYWSGGLENGIHALPILPNGATLWAGYLGRPVSYGCVVLGSYESALLYDWAEIGTPVEIQW